MIELIIVAWLIVCLVGIYLKLKQIYQRIKGTPTDIKLAIQQDHKSKAYKVKETL